LPSSRGIPLPERATPHAAGYDIRSAEEAVLAPGEIRLVPTGLMMELPEGVECQVRPRSGLAVRHGITLPNSPGTIDPDYRGEVGVILINHGQEPFVIRRGDRVAQMVVHRVCRVVWAVCGELSRTERGDGGFGHTR